MIQPQQQIRFGAPLTPVVKALLAVNVALFLFQAVSNKGMVLIFGLNPTDVYTHRMYWQFLTYMFIHGGITHLVFNMLVLWMFGGDVEVILGSKRFIILYLFAGIGAGITTTFFQNSLIIGSSGAIFALMIGYAMFYPDRMVLFMFVIPLKVKYMIFILIAMEIFLTYSEANDGIAHFTHLSGGLIGFLYILLFMRGLTVERLFRQRTKTRGVLKVVRFPKKDQPEHEDDDEGPTIH